MNAWEWKASVTIDLQTNYGSVTSPIVVLDPEVASRIAAGEVIESPASVVKELVENALDANGRHIEVEIQSGGIEELRVTDDGNGIPRDQLTDAFKRHATSKLRTEQDLYSVKTLGFRGEALAAIAAAANVEIVTRTAKSPVAGMIRFHGGKSTGEGNAAAALGTSVTVSELFASLPARRRFLKDSRAEARAVARMLTETALAWPEVSFRLRSGDRTLLNTPGTGNLRDTIASIYGVETSDALIDLSGKSEDHDAIATVTGLASNPSLHKGSRRHLLLVANLRVVNHTKLVHAIEQGYKGLLPSRRHPLAVVRVDVPPDQIDVNVHPTKSEIRFRHEQLVYGTVKNAVREALLKAPPFDGPSLGTPVGDGLDRPSPQARSVLASAVSSPLLKTATSPTHEPKPVAHPPQTGQRPLPLQERLPTLRPLGQVGLTYLTAEAPDGLYLVDQHAAHERVQYDTLLKSRESGKVDSQPLLQTSVTPLTPALLAIAEDKTNELEALGWSLDVMDGGALIVRAMPAVLTDKEPSQALSDYLEQLAVENRLDGIDRSLATLACHASVRAGDSLEIDQQRALLRALEQTDNPLTCPHGRPTVVYISNDSLRRSFGRSEPH